MIFARKIFIALLFAALMAPAIAAAQFSRQGIFGCSRNAAALSGSVGAFSATGGVFVPVADYTVELNTGTLVYLECVLRGIVDRESEAANSADVGRRVQFITGGNDNNPYFSVDRTKERLAFQEKSRLLSLQDENLISAMGATLAGDVRRTSAKSFMQQTRDDAAVLRCSGMIEGATGLDSIAHLGNPACYAIGEYVLYNEILDARDARYLGNIDDELDWGNGFYCVSRVEENGARVCDTPSIYVEETGLQAITSGFRRVESANNIDQMVGALYAGLGTQALTGSGGLRTGLTTAIGSGASYLSRMTTESNQGLRNAAANAALGILSSARSVEIQYNQVVSAIANSLTNAVNQLKGMERQCWDLIIYNTQPAPAKHVCAAPPVDGKCTGVSGAALTIATSTRFSQAIINGQISPIATQAVANVQKSQTALGLIDQLINAVSDTQSLDAQRLALVQLDQLVSQGRLHVAADVTSVQQQQSAVADAMAQLITDPANGIKTRWADGTIDPGTVLNTGTGWCNVANQAVIDYWDAQWH